MCDGLIILELDHGEPIHCWYVWIVWCTVNKETKLIWDYKNKRFGWTPSNPPVHGPGDDIWKFLLWVMPYIDSTDLVWHNNTFCSDRLISLTIPIHMLTTICVCMSHSIWGNIVFVKPLKVSSVHMWKSSFLFW